ncbi:MAG: nucleotide exchange factor GrpE [Oscillospiraceae bacterium]|jgi:molecular chaperone GrpE
MSEKTAKNDAAEDKKTADEKAVPTSEEVKKDTKKSESKKESEKEEKSNKKKDKSAEELEKLRKELADEKDKYLRVLAEYDNYRKRSQKERESIYADVRSDTVEKFLPVYDNLERALKQETTDEAYSKGVEMIMAQFKEIMANAGVTEIEASAGTTFDPNIHNAVMHVEDETLGESVIVEEFQKGFRLGDKILRHSVVKVAN